MHGDGPYHPYRFSTTTQGARSNGLAYNKTVTHSTNSGVTVKQEMAIRFVESMLRNPQYLTLTPEEMASAAVAAASALVAKL